ncbi:hypothetical protein BKA70DRAFT_1296589 [Coprinopsis sp. MPI-PUGE-AT-0042]|nr:hypothetical protein BKA70DRAFT_1296589 [Coprinopsis sp. MPI-PUGE-AT-0042]
MPVARTTLNNATGSSSASSAPYARPQNKWEPAWKFEFPPSNSPLRVEANWRVSTLSTTRMIKKTDAKDQYHLQAYELDRLKPDIQRYRIPGKSFPGMRSMYKEVDVERIAWRKYGGPESFERFLREANDNYTGTRTPFGYPQAYRHVFVTAPPKAATRPRAWKRSVVPIMPYDEMSPVQQVLYEMGA